MDENQNQIKEQMKQKTRTVSAKSIVLIVSVCVLIAAAAVLLILMAQNGLDDPAAQAATQEGEVIEVSPNTLQSPAQNTTSSKGFPVSFTGGKILDVEAIGGGVYVLTKDALCFVSGTGDFHTPINHGYSEPVLESNGKYAVLFDRLSGKFMLLSDRKIQFSGQSENGQQINCAAIGPNGCFAVAAKGANYSSLLTYYNKSGKILFSWECAKEYIVAIDISKGKNNLLCAALNARNGEITTKMYLLNIAKTETVFEYEFGGAAAMECRFSGKNEAIVICNDRRVLVDLRQEEPEPLVFSYSSDLLCRASDEKGNTAVACQKFGSFDTYEISILDRRNELLCTAETDEKVLGLYCNDGKVYVLTNNSVFKLSNRGHLSRIKSLPEVRLGFAVNQSNVYHYSLNTLYKN